MKHVFPQGNFLLVLFHPPWQWVITVCPKESDSLEVISMPCKLFAGNINADAAVIQPEFEINIAESFFWQNTLPSENLNPLKYCYSMCIFVLQYV